MDQDELRSIPPLQGCLYCHAEGTTALAAGRKVLGLGSDYPLLKCQHCNTVAQLDVDIRDPAQWRIRYRRVNRSPRYYYVALRFRSAGWLSAHEALEISRNGYVQRARVQQARAGDLSWLSAPTALPAPLLAESAGHVYLTLRAVSLQSAGAPNVLMRRGPASVIDSGKLYVTGEQLFLLGQRGDWSHALADVVEVRYDDRSWSAVVDASSELLEYRGAYATDQYDPQLIVAVLEALWQPA